MLFNPVNVKSIGIDFLLDSCSAYCTLEHEDSQFQIFCSEQMEKRKEITFTRVLLMAELACSKNSLPIGQIGSTICLVALKGTLAIILPHPLLPILNTILEQISKK